MQAACRWSFVIAALVCAGLPVADALAEDEVGQYEWIVQQVGQPTALAYSTDAADKVFVASASGVLASMLLKDGTINWRRVATTTGGGMRLLRAGSKGLLSVTGQGTVQFWKGSTGDLTWQREYSDRVVDVHIVGPASKQNVVVIRESEVEVRSNGGKHEWSAAAGTDSRYWAAAPSGDEVICAVSSKRGGSDVQAVQIDVATGKVTKTTPLPASIAKPLESSSFVVVDSHLVVLSGGSVAAHSMCGEASSGETSFDLQKLKTSSKVAFTLMPWQRTPGVFAATNGATTAIFGLSNKGLKQLRTFDDVAVVGPVHTVHDDEAGQPVAVAIVGSEGTKIQLLDPASGNVQPAINAEGYTTKDHGPARLLLVRELSSGKHHTVISAADHSLVGIQGSKVNWVREEALASIKDTAFYGRATTYTSKKATDDSLGVAISAQLSQIPAFVGELANKPAQLAAAFTNFAASFGKEPKRSKPTLLANAKVPASAEALRGFGANKLILCVTKASKLYALEATTSEIVWNRYFGSGAELVGGDSNACAEGQGKCGLWMKLLPSSASAYSELVVVTPKDGENQQIHWIDPATGKDLHSEAAPAAGIKSLMPLPRSESPGAAKVQPFLLIDTKSKVHSLPKGNADAAARLDQAAEKLFHFEVNRRSQDVGGFSLNKNPSGTELLNMWNLELGDVGETIVAAAVPEHREWAHVPVHIKGDASILYKYVNRNMMSLVSSSVGTAGKEKGVSSLNLYVLDSVTGHVLHQTRIVGGTGPVHMVMCDNWVLMHYWNEKRTRFELTVVEFFESKADDGAWNILFNSPTSMTTSAHHMDAPVPLQQTYIFPTGVTSMGVTATQKGVTPRSIIMALTTDHLLAVSKEMLNPRRPYHSSPGVIDKERALVANMARYAPTKDEPVPPYAPVIPLRPMDVLTYYNPIGQVAGISSSPTSLESTSLVFSYGLDLFFSPVQTAKAYDVLSPGFNYPLLFGSVGSVAAAVVVTSVFSSSRALADRWK